MGKYEDYAKGVLADTFGERWDPKNDFVFSFGPDAGTGEVDGSVDGVIAVEIAVGSPKQVRASLLDLMFHPLPGKLLLLVDTPGHSTEPSVIQAATILGRAECSGVVYRLPVEGDHDLEAIRVDLADVVDEYIGETEKNLVWVFDGVKGSDSVLFLDEAKRLLVRRTNDEDEGDRNG